MTVSTLIVVVVFFLCTAIGLVRLAYGHSVRFLLWVGIGAYLAFCATIVLPQVADHMPAAADFLAQEVLVPNDVSQETRDEAAANVAARKEAIERAQEGAAEGFLA